MIKKCYRLMVLCEFIHTLPIEQCNYMADIDEDYTSKKEWVKNAKEYTAEFNKKFNTLYTYQDFFGEPDSFADNGWKYCTLCGKSFWSFEGHDCEAW